MLSDTTFAAKAPSFQSAPCVQGEWTEPDSKAEIRIGVSIRALRAGRMALSDPVIIVPGVSIRALRAGRMRGRRRFRSRTTCFNPRPACRANGPKSISSNSRQVFQSAPCVQGEWIAMSPICCGQVFQSAPCVQGECQRAIYEMLDQSGFNPRPACRANERHVELVEQAQPVSIRALRAGRMNPKAITDDDMDSFNPRPACRANGATSTARGGPIGFNPRPACRANAGLLRLRLRRSRVSIRALRAGRMWECS